MNYPVWDITFIGGSVLIALISVTHVLVAHFAVGGGFFLWLTDWKSIRTHDIRLTEYVKQHSWFFLLLTMVFGGVSGVGIWFIIALVHPAGTSVLIHNYVFAWAIEWVFFLGEIVALLIYHYFFDALTERKRLLIVFFYFIFAWLSLFTINGIVSTMLTPGKWLETRYFWDGFFNPSFFPSLFFRTFVSTMLAGMFALITAVFLKEEPFRVQMMRYGSKWMLLSFIGLVPSALWYYAAVPGQIRTIALDINNETIVFVNLFLTAPILIFILGIFFFLRVSVAMQKILVFVLIAIGLSWMGGFEYIREIARKPWVIYGHMYSSSLTEPDLARTTTNGALATAKWSPVKTVTPENRMAAGKALCRLQCLSCHTVNGIYNDIKKHTAELTYQGILAQLRGQGKYKSYMPPFAGTKTESEVLAAYLGVGLHGKKQHPERICQYDEQPVNIPPFDPVKDQYVLLVWNDLGMHCISDNDQWFSILPPANTLEAQLIRRGPIPEVITSGVTLTYKVEPGFENPAEAIDFWDYAETVYGKKLKKNTGLTGNGLSGEFVYDDHAHAFVAEQIPVSPYQMTAKGKIFNPYPLFTIEARDQKTGDMLMQTRAVAPTSTEIGCRYCHGGGWRWKDASGLSDETAMNILKIHDRNNRTQLFQKAKNGKPFLCQGCHADPALNREGSPGVLNFSAAIHGWHAMYLTGLKQDACIFCHPAAMSGNTRCGRGVHKNTGITCINCHGTIEDHAIALLKAETGKPSARAILPHITPRADLTKEAIVPRKPWINGPDCLACHIDFNQPGPVPSAFNQWSTDRDELYCFRMDYSGSIRCQACHGATHALYPAQNPLGPHRDNLQPLQYSGLPYAVGANYQCSTCHDMDMAYSIHHENMERMVRVTE